MCGIVGILARSGSAHPDEKTIEHMVRSIYHRGPDEQQWMVKDRIALGVSRLSVIDPSGSHQPLKNENGDVVVVFNGEIYNYKEMRSVLELAGHEFGTIGDGEVIVHGYEEWGIDVFEKLRGMFAIALWDDRRERLVLARDRMGIKPLYICQTPSQMLFASEVKAIFASGAAAARLRPEMLGCYLALRYVPSPDTLFEGIKKVRPGWYIAVEKAGWNDGCFHRHRLAPKHSIEEPAAASKLYEKLSRSTQYRLQSDVPLGVFLSGGLDSGFLAVMATHHGGRPVDAFSIGFDRGGVYDETAAAGVVAEQVRARHHTIHMDHKEFVQKLPQSVYHMDEPMADPSSVPMMALSQLAHNHVKVVLSGEGADELFAGYPRHVGERLAMAFRFPGLPTRAIASCCRRWLSRSVVRGIEGIGIRDRHRRHLFWEAAMPDRVRHGILPGASGPDPALEVFLRCSQQALEAGAADSLDELFYFDLTSYLVEDLLLKKDKMGMSASIETRVPYLDQDVVAFSLQLDATLKIQRLTGKRIFRKVLAAHLPAAVLNRPKVGFAVPLREWFCKELREVVETTLTDSTGFLAEHVNAEAVASVLAAHLRGQDFSLAIYSLLILELWGRIFLRGEHPDEVSSQLSRLLAV